jgi:hypothetical protein
MLGVYFCYGGYMAWILLTGIAWALGTREAPIDAGADAGAPSAAAPARQALTV